MKEKLALFYFNSLSMTVIAYVDEYHEFTPGEEFNLQLVSANLNTNKIVFRIN